MIETGRLCVKIAGRDAGKKCVVVDILDNKFVLVDGETRRRKCNIMHLEPLEQKIGIKKNASHEEVREALKEVGIEARETKPKKEGEKPKKERKTPEQLRQQKEEKKKFRLFSREKVEKKIEEKKKGMEEKAEKKAEVAKEEGKEAAGKEEVKN